MSQLRSRDEADQRAASTATVGVAGDCRLEKSKSWRQQLRSVLLVLLMSARPSREAPEPPALIDESPVSLGALSRMRLIAHLLWSSCYDAIFKAELQENEAACGSDGQLVPTSYRARLKGERAEKYDHRRMIQRRDELAIRLHANNERHWSPSILARSMTYFLHTTAWQRHIEGRCVAVLALCAHAACCICACCYVRLYVLFNQCFACVQLL